MIRSWFGKNKLEVFFLIALSFCLILSWILYAAYGHRLITSIYEGKSIGGLNRLIKHQEAQPMQAYYQKADILLILISTVAICLILLRIFSAWGFLDTMIIVLVSAGLFCSIAGIIGHILSAPLFQWNGSRLAWTFSFARGYPMYPNPIKEPLLCVGYGPLGCLAYLPATIMRTPTLSIIFASLIAAFFYFIPIILLCFKGRQARLQKAIFLCISFSIFSLLTLNSAALRYVAFNVHVDAPALAFSMLACIFIYYSRAENNKVFSVLSAIFAVLAVWTKQTLLPILFALPFYLLILRDYKGLKKYLLYLMISGLVISVSFLFVFNTKHLFFWMFTLWQRQPWQGSDKALVLFQAAKFLLKECAFYLAVLFIYSWHQLRSLSWAPRRLKAYLGSHIWVLLFMVSIFLVPTSLMGKVKVGGAANTLGPTVYFLASASTLALTNFLFGIQYYRMRLWKNIAKISFILLFVGLIGTNIPRLLCFTTQFKKIVSNEQQIAYEFARRHPTKTYFPFNPLVSLLTEGKLYHFYGGIWDLEIAGFQLDAKYLRTHTPIHMQFVAIPPGTDASIKTNFLDKYLSEFPKLITIDELAGWAIYKKPSR